MERLGVLFLFLGLAGNLAAAQSGEDPATLYASAGFVFTGRVEAIKPAQTGLIAQFKADQIIKGLPAGTTLQVELPLKSRCHEFEDTHTYLVYGHRIGQTLWADPCEGSKLVSQAEADLRYIHTLNKKVSEQCNHKRLARLAAESPIVVTAEVIGTEDTLESEPKTQLLFRPWCGLVATTEDAYYSVHNVLKGQIRDSRILVEHLICFDTITVNGYYPELSPELFKEGNVLLLFLKAGSHQTHKVLPPAVTSVYSDRDENCGAVLADADAAHDLAQSISTIPDTSRYIEWLKEDVVGLLSDSERSVFVQERRPDVPTDH